VNIILNEAETRVLGSLVEKEITTPDYYPLSLNALINACNQKSNRDPLLHLDESAVRQALHVLNEKGLAGATSSADSRVTKYEHRLQEAFNFHRNEIAILCVLLLRGPQTPGELRGRAERMQNRRAESRRARLAQDRGSNRVNPLRHRCDLRPESGLHGRIGHSAGTTCARPPGQTRSNVQHTPWTRSLPSPHPGTQPTLADAHHAATGEPKSCPTTGATERWPSA